MKHLSQLTNNTMVILITTMRRHEARGSINKQYSLNINPDGN